jgi:hypothetical protein
VAFTILDRWQGIGLSSLLTFAVARSAWERGIKTLTGVFLSQNDAAAGVFAKAGALAKVRAVCVRIRMRNAGLRVSASASAIRTCGASLRVSTRVLHCTDVMHSHACTCSTRVRGCLWVLSHTHVRAQNQPTGRRC